MSYRPALFLLLGTLACQPSPARKVQAGVVGSVSVDTVPVLDIGSVDASGGVVFTNVIDATRLSSGVIVAADRGSHSLRFLTPQGALLREVGRKGAGPGEFDMLTWLGQCGSDSLFAWDPRQGRITVLDSAGVVVRQFALPGGTAAIRCSAAGDLLAIGAMKGLGMPGEFAPIITAELTSFRRDGSPVHSFGAITVGRNRPLAAVVAIAVADDRIFVGHGDSASVEARSFEGKYLASVSLGTVGRPVEPRHYAAAIEHLLLGLILPEDRERPREMLLRIPAPKILPAYREIFTDPTGAIWAVTSPLGDGVTVLQGADSLGKPLGELRIPVELDVREIGREYLLGIAENASGEQRVLLYRLHR